MPTPELSYPLNPPNPSPPSSNPNPPSPPSPAPPPASPPGDPCTLLNQINDDIEPQCDNLHFGTEKCQIDWAYFNTAPCGFGTKPYQNGIGFAGSYFNAFDEKGFLRIEGQADSEAGEPNLYSYVGTTPAFEVYMYKDGLNIKGLQSKIGGGSSEACHIKVFKDSQETEIDYQGVTNLSSEGAEIFKSQLFKQTIELFVKKYSYEEEWVGLEANVSKSFVWGGLDTSNYYRLMHDEVGEERGFLEILKGGYSYYHQMMVKDTAINHYSQFSSNNYYKNFVMDATHGEDELYFVGVIVKALTNEVEASTYNSYYENTYATLVSKSTESYVYLTWGNDYSFLESKNNQARVFGTAEAGAKFFDIKTQGTVSFQLQEGQDYMYVAPKDIPEKSDDHHYAGFHTLTYGPADDEKKVAFVSSADVDLTDLVASDPCWADYPCFYDPSTAGAPCLAPLTLGGGPNDDCKLSSFGVEVEGGQGFELYQYAYGIDLKTRGAASPAVKIYTDQNTVMQLDSIGDAQAGVNAKRYDGAIQSYNLVDSSYGYQSIEVNNGSNIRSSAGFETADITLYDGGGNNQIDIGINSAQASIGYRFGSETLAFGYAKSDRVVWEVQHVGSAAYSYLEAKNDEGKVQVSKEGLYGYMFSNQTRSVLTLYGNDGYCEAVAKNDEGKFQVSQGNNYGYHLATMEVVDSYCKFGDNYAFSTAGITESKHQVSRDSNYGYMATTSSVADIELRKDTCYSKLISDNSEGKVQVSKSSNYAFMNAKEDKCSVYLFKGSASIDISTSDAQDKQIKLRSVDVCEGGTTKQMIILASEPF